jgi:hypothetical protein
MFRGIAFLFSTVKGTSPNSFLPVLYLYKVSFPDSCEKGYPILVKSLAGCLTGPPEIWYDAPISLVREVAVTQKKEAALCT